MTTKLVQKHLFKGIQEFEIVDDAVNICIKSPLKKEETLTVMLAVLNSEPIISASRLEFTSRVNNEALVSLHLAKPNPQEFNAFVNLLKQKIRDEFKAFAGLKTDSAPALEGNVYEEPPEFGSAEDINVKAHKKWKPVNTADVEDSIRMLREYVGGDEIHPLLSALEALLADPENVVIRKSVFKEFEVLGPGQGAVLTYAPYVGILMSGDPYDSF
jgi:hypothetical protein